MEVEVIPGGYIVTQGHRWWSVAWRGATPTIVDHLREPVKPNSDTGRAVVGAIRSLLRAS
jgi:hypothetical protein